MDRRRVGRAYPPMEPSRSVERRSGSADAVGDANPLYRDTEAARAAGYPDVIAPPTFAVVISQPATRQASRDPELGIDYSRVLHGEQRFVHHRPFHAGDVVRASLTIEELRPAGKNWLMTTRADFVSEGETVCTAYSTILVRGG